MDAWEIFQDHPVTGIGGGGWENIYGQYQKYYYVSNDAHSYGVQVIVEEGIPGLLALISIAVLFILALRTAWHKRQREQQTLLLMAAAIFAHSMIDVDLAFFGYF